MPVNIRPMAALGLASMLGVAPCANTPGCPPSPNPPTGQVRNGACNLAFDAVPGNASCYVQPTTHVPDVRLFVAGLNHRGDDALRVVDQPGIDSLANFIARDHGDVDALVVAISGPGHAPCDAGTFAPAQGETKNSHCLAAALTARLGNHFTVVSEPPGEHRSGEALVVGARWRAIRVRSVGCGYDCNPALAVTLQDARYDEDRRVEFTIYVAHTPGDNDAYLSLRALAADARDHQSRRALTPIFVGDYNIPNCPNVPIEQCQYQISETFMRANFLWANRSPVLHCPAAGGRSEVNLDVFSHGSLMHTFIGCRDSMDMFNYGCSAGSLVPVRVMYTARDDGQPDFPHEGIHLPEIRHATLGIGLSIRRDPVCDCTCVARTAANGCGRSDSCGNVCECPDTHTCRGTTCVRRNGPGECGGIRCETGEICCMNGDLGECCNSTTYCSIRTHQCEPRGSRPER